jgi:hypothetical protein
VQQGGVWRERGQVQGRVSLDGPKTARITDASRRFERDPDAFRVRRGFEDEQRAMLERFVSYVDRSIDRSQRKIEEVQGYLPQAVDLESNPEVLEMTAKIEDALKRAEAEGEAGNVDESMRLLTEAETLRASKTSLQKRLLNEGGGETEAMRMSGNFHLLRVCRACGAKLSIKDSDERLAEHFGGRMHVGVVKARETLEALRGGGRYTAAAASSGDRVRPVGRDEDRAPV